MLWNNQRIFSLSIIYYFDIFQQYKIQSGKIYFSSTKYSLGKYISAVQNTVWENIFQQYKIQSGKVSFTKYSLGKYPLQNTVWENIIFNYPLQKKNHLFLSRFCRKKLSILFQSVLLVLNVL